MTRQDAIQATFEVAGSAIATIALTVAVILATPFMVLGWLLIRLGWVHD